MRPPRCMLRKETCGRTRAMLINQKVIDAINEQIGYEFSASLQYYAIGAYFAAEALPQLSTLFQTGRGRDRACDSLYQICGRHRWSGDDSFCGRARVELLQR